MFLRQWRGKIGTGNQKPEKRDSKTEKRNWIIETVPYRSQSGIQQSIRSKLASTTAASDSNLETRLHCSGRLPLFTCFGLRFSSFDFLLSNF